MVSSSLILGTLAASAAAGRAPSIPTLIDRLQKPEACAKAADALLARGEKAAPALVALLEVVARGDACSADAVAPVVAIVRFNNQEARRAAAIIHKMLTDGRRELLPEGRRHLVLLFGRMAGLRDDARGFLTELLDDADEEVARAAAVGLGANFPPDDALGKKLDTMLEKPSTRVRAAALVASAASCTRFVPWLSRAVELFALEADDPSYAVIVDLVYSALLDPGCRLEPADHHGHPQFLLAMSAHPNEQVAAHCARMVGRTWPDERMVAQLAYRLIEPPHASPTYRASVIDGLAQSGKAAVLALPLLIDELDDQAPSVRRACVEALAVLGPLAGDAASKLRVVASDDPDPQVRGAARRALANVFGLGISPEYASRSCHYGVRPSSVICCEPECPRWADRGTRATVDLERQVFAGIGVVSASLRTPGRESQSAQHAARTALHRYLAGFIAAAVRDYLRVAPRANFGSASATRAQKALKVDYDPLLRKQADAFVDRLLERLSVEELASVPGRASLVTVGAEAFLSHLRSLREAASADLVAALERRVGRTFGIPEAMVARDNARQLPRWVIEGSGLFVSAAGLEFRGLGAVDGAGERGSLDPEKHAGRLALGVLVEVMADFGSRMLRAYRQRFADPGNYLVTDAGWIGTEASRVSDRWQDPSNGRHYALAKVSLRDYLRRLARMPEIHSRLRRFCDERAESVFRAAAVVLQPYEGSLWQSSDVGPGRGRVIPIPGTLVGGGMARNDAGWLLAIASGPKQTTLIGLGPTGERKWQRRAKIPWRRVVRLDGSRFLLAGQEHESSRDPSPEHRFYLAEIDQQGEMQWEHTLRISGWHDVVSVVPSASGAIYLAVGDKGYGRSGHRKILLARVERSGTLRWTHEYSGWGSIRLPGIVALADDSVVVLAQAQHCLDPQADPACEGDPMCAWNPAHARCGWNKALYKYAADGQRVWERHFKWEGHPSNVIATAGGELQLATVSSGEVSVTRLDSSGRVKWTRTSAAPIASIEEGAPACRMNGEDHMMLVGTSDTGDVLVLEFDADGDLLVQRRYGGRGRDVGHASFASEHGMLVVGDSDSPNLPGSSATVPSGIYMIDVLSD